MKPLVLIATASRWFPTARLGMALASAGFAVEAVCPRRHPIRVTRAVRRIYIYNGLAPVESLRAAIAKSRPTIVIPCDDMAVLNLHKLYETERNRGKAGDETRALIERSLGPSTSFPIVTTRTTFTKLAAQEGIRVPGSETISDIRSVRQWTGNVGFPAIFKTDGTSGGDGVRIVRSMDEAERAFEKLLAPPSLLLAAKRAVIDRDTTLVWPSLMRRRYAVSAQSYVHGREATSTIACWSGVVLASLHFEVLNKASATGAATVLRLIENPEMSSAAERMVRRLGLSGLIGFDFMLEAKTGDCYLIEINPRATQTGHLALGAGRDLSAALFAAISGLPLKESQTVTDDRTIALFPHEWLKNPESPFLLSGYHDVPWEEAEFIRVCVGTRRKQMGLYSQRSWTHALSPDRHPRQ
jgi:formate-dependent phosphoribosylglycinamide formyltransferase (GAR transformylase)